MKWKLAFVALWVALLAPGVSSASVLDFSTGTAGVGGTITDLGGGNAMGSGIYIDTLTVSILGSNTVYDVDGAFACANGGGGSCGALSFDTITGDISIAGSVMSLGVGPTNLLVGHIDNWIFNAGAGTATFYATGTDAKDPALLTALGIPSTTPFSFVGFSIGFGPATSCGEGLTCYDAISTNFLNNSGVGGNEVPEPGTLILLGGGLLGLVRARRRVA